MIVYPGVFVEPLLMIVTGDLCAAMTITVRRAKKATRIPCDGIFRSDQNERGMLFVSQLFLP